MSDPTAAKPAPNSSKKWLVIGLALMLALLGAGAAGWFFLSSQAPNEAPSAAPAQPPTFYALQPFTVNFNDDSGRMLHLGLSLELEDPSSAQHLANYMPEIRNRILLLLAEQPADRLETANDKRRLAEELRALFSQPFDGVNGFPVRQVLFTDFIVQ